MFCVHNSTMVIILFYNVHISTFKIKPNLEFVVINITNIPSARSQVLKSIHSPYCPYPIIPFSDTIIII